MTALLAIAVPTAVEPKSSALISPATAVTLVKSVGASVMLALPSKDTPAIVLAVVRVAALPVVF